MRRVFSLDMAYHLSRRSKARIAKARNTVTIRNMRVPIITNKLCNIAACSRRPLRVRSFLQKISRRLRIFPRVKLQWQERPIKFVNMNIQKQEKVQNTFCLSSKLKS